LPAWRVGLAGALFGVVLGAVEPPFALLLGAPAADWSGAETPVAAGLAGLVGGGLSLAVYFSCRRRAVATTRPPHR
jgi:hypothetical protein